MIKRSFIGYELKDKVLISLFLTINASNIVNLAIQRITNLSGCVSLMELSLSSNDVSK
jgi:hypothetical protein